MLIENDLFVFKARQLKSKDERLFNSKKANQ